MSDKKFGINASFHGDTVRLDGERDYTVHDLIGIVHEMSEREQRPKWEDRQWNQMDAMGEIDAVDRMAGHSRFEILIPVNKIWKKLFKKEK